MKRSAFFMIATALLASRTTAGAADGQKRQAVTITWVRPERLSPAQRAALTRMLWEAAEGESLRGVLVRDSRPRQVCAGPGMGKQREDSEAAGGAMKHPLCLGAACERGGAVRGRRRRRRNHASHRPT